MSRVELRGVDTRDPRALIKWGAERYRRLCVLWSGGKDSTALLLETLDVVSRMRRPPKLIVAYVHIPHNTDPAVLDYVVSLALELKIDLWILWRQWNFWEALMECGFPDQSGRRWCALEFKHRVIRRFLGGRGILLLSGVRKSDSRRRERNVSSPFTYVRVWESWCLSPLWLTDKRYVWSVLREHGVPPNPCYRDMGHSGNCLICLPFQPERLIQRTLNCVVEWRLWEIVGSIVFTYYERRGYRIVAERCYRAVEPFLERDLVGDSSLDEFLSDDPPEIDSDPRVTEVVNKLLRMIESSPDTKEMKAVRLSSLTHI